MPTVDSQTKLTKLREIDISLQRKQKNKKTAAKFGVFDKVPEGSIFSFL